MFILAGYGYVGRAYYELISTYFHTEIVDPQYTESYISDFPFAQGLICCVGTPTTSSGGYDLSALCAVISSTPAYMPILIKSTITIEDWDYLKREFPKHSLTFSPEFLTAQRAIEDVYERTYEVIAGDDIDFWRRTFNTVKPHAWVYSCEPEEAIVAKQFMNAFLATKVSFFNQIYDYCVENDIDFNEVRALMSVDKRIGGSHTRVNSPRGWGGMCFPKDTEALLHTAKQSNVSLSILEEAVSYNKKVRE